PDPTASRWVKHTNLSLACQAERGETGLLKADLGNGGLSLKFAPNSYGDICFSGTAATDSRTTRVVRSMRPAGMVSASFQDRSAPFSSAIWAASRRLNSTN